MSFTKKNPKLGFSLVELMIVVAIIGVLATVGVPTFRKMVQKAKKSEAKVMLGGIYTAEVAFNSEYSVYGSGLQGIGFDTGAPSTYSVGFPSNTCTDQYVAAPKPTAAAAFNSLNAAFPGYYSVAANKIGILTPTGLVPTKCETAVVADDGATFTATATGKIAPNAPLDDSGTGAHLDKWTMDNARTLTNTQEGIY